MGLFDSVTDAVSDAVNSGTSALKSVTDSIPKLPDIPNITIPDIPDIPNIPLLPSVFGLPSISTSTLTSNIPSLPKLPRFPLLPDIPNPLDVWPPKFPTWPLVPSPPDVSESIKQLEHIKNVYDVLNGTKNVSNIPTSVTEIISITNKYITGIGTFKNIVSTINSLDKSTNLANVYNSINVISLALPNIQLNLEKISKTIPLVSANISSLGNKSGELDKPLMDVSAQLDQLQNKFKSITDVITLIQTNVTNIQKITNTLDMGKIQKMITEFTNMNNIVSIITNFANSIKDVDLNSIAITITTTINNTSTKLKEPIEKTLTGMKDNITKIMDFSKNINVLFDNVKALPDSIQTIKSNAPKMDNVFSGLNSFVISIKDLETKLSLISQFTKLQEFAPQLTQYMESIKENTTILTKFKLPTVDDITKMFSGLEDQLGKLVNMLPLDWAKGVVDLLSQFKLSIPANIKVDVGDDFESGIDTAIKYLVIGGIILLAIPIILNITLK